MRQLRGFDKIKDLPSGDSAVISFPIRRKDVSSWSVVDQLWYVPNGDFVISVGGSSRDLPLVSHPSTPFLVVSPFSFSIRLSINVDACTERHLDAVI